MKGKFMNDKFDELVKGLAQSPDKQSDQHNPKHDSAKTNKSVKSNAIKIQCLIAVSLALAALGSAPDVRADVVTAWNEIALATQAAVPGAIRTPPAARALAMVHLAVF